MLNRLDSIIKRHKDTNSVRLHNMIYKIQRHVLSWANKKKIENLSRGT